MPEKLVVDIITSEMKGINGANRVTEKLIFGYDVFADHEVDLRYLYTEDGKVECATYTSKMGNYSEEYLTQRGRIEGLKKSALYRTYPVQALMQYKAIRRCKQAVDIYLQENKPAQCIIFQDVFCAYYYLRSTKGKKRNEKTLLITHTDKDPMEQLLINRPELAGHGAEKKLRNLFKYVFESLDKVVTICTPALNYMSSHYAANLACILNGIEDLPAQAEPIQKDPSKKKVVILGSVIYRKGHDLLVKGLDLLTPEERAQVEVHVVGRGNYLETLKQEIKDSGYEKHCVLHGELREVSGVLAQMDAMILPSRADTVPIAIIEGLRSGLPVFSTAVGEVPNMIDGCGVIIEATAEGVAKTFRYVLNEEQEMKKLARKAREQYESKFTLQVMISKYAQEIKELFN